MNKEKSSYRKYSKEERAVHLKRFRESGLTLYGYSKSVGIEPNTFRYWVKSSTESTSDLVSCVCKRDGVSMGKRSANNIAPAANTPAANAPTGGCDVFPVAPIEFNTDQEETPMREERRDLAEEKRLLEEELAEIKEKLKAAEDRAYQAELKSFVLDTLIEVADETYGLDLKKNFGSQR